MKIFDRSQSYLKKIISVDPKFVKNTKEILSFKSQSDLAKLKIKKEGYC